MARPALEVADIFRDHGAAWREANRGHVSLAQMKVMSAIESCRTAALGGHVARCEDCSHTIIAYNSCRNRHCPKCQGAAARTWMEEREAELLPVPYFHIVFTLPAAIGDIAYQNKAVIYDLLFKASAETMLTIAADPKHLGARIAITSVLHTWGSAMTHHPHVHMIVPGGGLSPDGERWIAARPNFFLPVLVLSKLFRRLMLEKLVAAHKAGKLIFFGEHAHLAERQGLRRLPGAAEEDEVVRLLQAPLRRPEGCARLPLPLHPPRRHLQPAPDRSRRDERHVQGQGLPGRGARPLHDHDARRPASSSAASCSTSCPRASTASATTACSPALPKPRWSPRLASCWRCPQPSRRPTRTLRRSTSSSAPAAAGA